MEYFRRMGIADRIRRAGLPLDHATDVVYCTAILGDELTRFEFSTSGQVLSGKAHEFADWPTPNPSTASPRSTSNRSSTRNWPDSRRCRYAGVPRWWARSGLATV